MADRILIVEDERITAEDLREVLTGLGYEVNAVASGAEAIAEVERNPPDLALMDIRIRGSMDGTETATILRERFDIPVIFLTAHADQATLDRAKQSRPVGYVVKPYQELELQASVEIALHKHRFDRRARSQHQQLTDALGAVILGIISVDLNETVVVFNQAAEDLTGWSKSDALQRPVRRVFRHPERGALAHRGQHCTGAACEWNFLRRCDRVRIGGRRRGGSGAASLGEGR
jgi:two-component system cell cycle sensor histidine kinase/response regulator CckA